ncbi:MAG TPA: protein kinase, partial [Urbifossiella sp.]|nr:protein kinase [Urbifossiella sp.]
MRFACPHCGKAFRAPTDAAGRTAKCNACGSTFPVAAPTDPADPAAPAATVSLPVDPPAPVDPNKRSTARPPVGSTDSRTGSHHGTRDPADASAGVPQRLGRFQVRGFVGEGSFAEVYAGYDPQLDREVALKVARPGTLGTARRVKRFLREARAAGNLRHPNIVPLYETGEDGGRHFLVTAFVRGRTLGAVIREAGPRGGLPVTDAAQLARKLAGAIAYAHAEGVVHRDVKPDNVMVDEKGEPHLMDFGLADRPDDGDERLTLPGVAVGTPAYMAPEQAAGESGLIGPAADQYALGCTLYELLTGQTPFAGPPQVQFVLHQSQDP